METALKIPVIENQRGPTCGLYALAAVARCLDAEKYKDLYATKGDDPLKRSDHSLRHMAKNTPLQTQKVEGGDERISKIGEVFSSSGMKELAEMIGLKASVVQANNRWLTVIREHIDSGKYLLAPFGVGSDGHPQMDGTRPHWCVIYGYDREKVTSKDGKEVMFRNLAMAMHWNKQYKFRLKNLAASSEGLKDFDLAYVKTGDKSSPPEKGLPQKQTFDSGTGKQVSIGYPLRFTAVGPGMAHVPLKGAVPMQFNADLPNELAGKLVSVSL